MKYEYFLQNLDGTVFSSGTSLLSATQAFNELGAEGWELVGVNGNVAFFKRVVTDEARCGAVTDMEGLEEGSSLTDPPDTGKAGCFA